MKQSEGKKKGKEKKTAKKKKGKSFDPGGYKYHFESDKYDNRFVTDGQPAER